MRQAILLLAILLGASAHAADLATTNDFLSAWSEAERLVYTLGFHEGLVSATVYATDPAVREIRFTHCLKTLTPRQMLAQIKKFANEHPEDWQQPIMVVGLEATLDLCEKIHWAADIK